jgi:hypothetical protein
MSIDAWTQFVAEFQQYLAVFDAPTRYFLYTIAIGITILSLVFSYYMTKISLEFAVDVLKEVFGLIKKTFELLTDSLKLLLKGDPKVVVDTRVEPLSEVSVEA